MSAKGAISNLCLRPTAGAVPGRGTSCTPPAKVVVNNRHLGAVGQMSQGFATQSTVASRQSDKIKLNQLLAKASHAQYQGDPLASRNLQAQINQRAQDVYGDNRTKVALVNQTAQRLSGQHAGAGSACRFIGGRNTHHMGSGSNAQCGNPPANYQSPTPTMSPAVAATTTTAVPNPATPAPGSGAQRLAALIKQK